MASSPQDLFSAQDQRAAIESMFNAASLGIIISDSEGRIQQVNPFANKLFGYEEGELLGKKIEALVPQDLRAIHESHRRDFNHNPKTRSMGLGLDLFALKKDGTLLPVEISLTHYQRKGKREIVSFVSDITERKKIEAELKELNAMLEKKVGERTEELSQAFMELQQTNLNLQEEMEQRKQAEIEAQAAFERERELNELKSRFVSMASHEFRTPLSAILSSASLIARYHSPADQEKRTKHIDTIKASVHVLTNILNDFLSLDKLEKGKVENFPTSFDLDDFSKGLVEEVEALAKPGQRVIYTSGGGTEPVFLDKQLLRSVLLNLLSNAIKYSGIGMEIQFVARLEGPRLTIVVRDQGIGIPEVDQKHLFETFFRAKNAAAIQGTGLGLNIVKRSLDLMGGFIEFESVENQGSAFTVVLPQARNEP